MKVIFAFFYLFCIALLFGTGYIVFFKGEHGAWFILTIAIILLASPEVTERKK